VVEHGDFTIGPESTPPTLELRDPVNRSIEAVDGASDYDNVDVGTHCTEAALEMPRVDFSRQECRCGHVTKVWQPVLTALGAA
jgi:hypothetical protein